MRLRTKILLILSAFLVLYFGTVYVLRVAAIEPTLTRFEERTAYRDVERSKIALMMEVERLHGLAIDAMGELGVLYEGSPHERNGGHWQRGHMFTLGLIIGGGTAQIQKNIISERGLGMPREPKAQA